ncbi:hypothetical protein JS533_001720 [Bifidobacterium amazonense]|uniref:Fibronectin type-III domain-containing protein n=1 Tax=Bifidobacterium amazonense TaxID=2809027 RepID=A0ABS9VSE1_9BIFI|nr:hypothetical protein [Bifidobacterium amazonense]MCH9275007.1 hypothetical protein [Bifidobacterium amazonense]
MTKTLHARLVAYMPGGDRLGILQQPLSFDASIIHDDLGALQIAYSRRAVGGGILKRGLEAGLEIALEVSDGGAWREPYNGRFLLIGRSRNAEDTSDTVTLTCQSIGWLMGKILNNDTAHLITDGDNKGKRAFLSRNPGTILKTIMDENAQRKGAATILTAGFDTGKDSGGTAWKSVYTLYYSLGTSLNSMLSSMVSGGAVDWRTDRRTLKVWNADSTSLSRDLSGTVHVSLAHDVLEAPEEESIEDLSSDILVEGDNGLTFREANTAAPTPWGKWESYVSQGGISDEATAKAFMQTTLASSARVRGQYTRSLLVVNAESLPLVDYMPGDWISAPTVSHGEKVRVRQITLSLDSSGVKASVTLNDKVYDAQIRQAKKIQGITGGASMAGSEGGRPAPENDHRVAKAPEGLVVATSAYIASDGSAQGLAVLSWAQVTQATDSTALDIHGYRAEYRKNATGAPWQYGGDADETTLAIGRLECGVEYAFRVRATPTYSDKPGQWSDQVVIRVASDTTPPSVPSTPVLTSKLGVVDVYWDGKNAAGGGMEADFDHCEVGISPGNGNWTYRDLIQGDGHCIVTGLEINSAWWFALRSVDRSGNMSDWSEGANVTVAPAVTQEDLDQSADKILEAAKKAAAEQVAVVDQKVQANTDAITANTASIDAISKHAAEVDKTIDEARKDIDAATSTADKALDAANKVGTAVDGLHNVYTGPDDPSVMEGVALKDGDLWNRTQPYWTRWAGEANNSASLLADFYTGWEGDANNSASWLVPLSTRIIGTYRWTGSQWASLTNADLENAKDSIKAQQQQLEQAAKDLADANQLISGNTAAIEKAREDITAASTTAKTALDKANSVGKTLDGLHNAFEGPTDPTTLTGVTVKQGDFWYKTQPYWTRWAGTANNSASLLADFYTYWEGTANDSASVLVTLDSRYVGIYVYDGNQWNERNLYAANILATGSIVAKLMAADSVNAQAIVAGAVTTDKLAANSVTAQKIMSDSILARHMTADSVTTKALAAESVTGDKIKANSIDAKHIVTGSLTSDLIKGNLLTGTTVQGGKFVTTNGRLLINDDGLLLKDASNNPTVTMNSADGSLTLKGPIMSGGSITGTTITGAIIQTTAAASRGVKLTSGGLVGYDTAGNATFTLDADGSLKLAGALVTNGTLTAPTVTGGTLTGSAITTTNGRLTLTDSGMILRNTAGETTFSLQTVDGSVEMKGSLTSGSTIMGATITGTTINGTTINGGTISGTTITGTTINGAEFNAGSIQISGYVDGYSVTTYIDSQGFRITHNGSMIGGITTNSSGNVMFRASAIGPDDYNYVSLTGSNALTLYDSGSQLFAISGSSSSYTGYMRLIADGTTFLKIGTMNGSDTYNSAVMSDTSGVDNSENYVMVAPSVSILSHTSGALIFSSSGWADTRGIEMYTTNSNVEIRNGDGAALTLEDGTAHLRSTQSNGVRIDMNSYYVALIAGSHHIQVKTDGITQTKSIAASNLASTAVAESRMVSLANDGVDLDDASSYDVVPVGIDELETGQLHDVLRLLADGDTSGAKTLLDQYESEQRVWTQRDYDQFDAAITRQQS